jgi:hypothetical protein
MASVSSLITILRGVFSDKVDPSVVCREAVQYWSGTLEKFLQQRDQLLNGRICDLPFDDIRRDPLTAIGRIYEHFGWTLSREVEQRMYAVLRKQTRRDGSHCYNLSQFGLTQTEGTAAFAAYCDRFGLLAQDRAGGEIMQAHAFR